MAHAEELGATAGEGEPAVTETAFALRAFSLSGVGDAATTSDWSAEQYAFALEAFGSGADPEECEVVFAVDTANASQAVAEKICRNCRGAGHLAAECPSPRRYRSLGYVGGLLACNRLQ